MLIHAPDSPCVSALAPSPNHGPRVGCDRPDMVVLHYTGAPQDETRAAWLADPGGEALRWLVDERSQVSAHYLVHEDGRVVQMVAEDRRAWHAGVAS